MTRFVFASAALLACAACSSSSSPGDSVADAAAPEASGPDATCEGACRETRLTATFGDGSGALDRAQFGDERDEAGMQRLYVEAHLGGDPACPEQASPTPERTLIVANIPRATAGEVLTRDAGVQSTLLDFGAKVTTDFPTTATELTLTVTAIDDKETPQWIAFDVSATFESGTVTGHVYATYCESMAE